MILAAPFLFLALPLWAEENQDSNQPPENNVGIEANQPLTAPNAEPSNANSDGAPAPASIRRGGSINSIYAAPDDNGGDNNNESNPPPQD